MATVIGTYVGLCFCVVVALLIMLAFISTYKRLRRIIKDGGSRC